jgi:hypothetical protein
LVTLFKYNKYFGQFFGRPRFKIGRFGRGQTAKRPTANPGQMAKVPTLHYLSDLLFKINQSI